MNSNKMESDKEEFTRLESDTGDWVLHFKKRRRFIYTFEF